MGTKQARIEKRGTLLLQCLAALPVEKAYCCACYKAPQSSAGRERCIWSQEQSVDNQKFFFVFLIFLKPLSQIPTGLNFRSHFPFPGLISIAILILMYPLFCKHSYLQHHCFAELQEASFVLGTEICLSVYHHLSIIYLPVYNIILYFRSRSLFP